MINKPCQLPLAYFLATNGRSPFILLSIHLSFYLSIKNPSIYLSSWVREIGSMVQLMPLLIVPFVAIIQTCRYFLDEHDTWRYVSITCM